MEEKKKKEEEEKKKKEKKKKNRKKEKEKTAKGRQHQLAGSRYKSSRKEGLFSLSLSMFNCQ